MMFKYDGLAMDTDGEYFAVFKDILTNEQVLLDCNGAFFWFKTNVNYEFKQDELSLALTELRARTK